MKGNNIKSAYIHIPFCKNICSYCDFCKMFYNKELVNNYLDSLSEEITSNYKNETLKTLYIGGGTPSSLSISELNKLFNITKGMCLDTNYEFSIEVNINDIEEEKLILFKNNGVNRLSIGIETFNDKYLEFLGRSHKSSDVDKKIRLAKKYFDNINIDLMYGFYNQTLVELKDDLEKVTKLNPTHISIYSLILEEHTKLYINNTPSIDEDVESEMYFYIIDYLNKFGFNHYEVSNFSKGSFKSIHNLTYWNNEHYYGFGLGASGYIGNIRYTNTRSLNNYLKGNYVIETEQISKKLDMQYQMILGLRKTGGIDKNVFFCKYNSSVEDIFDIIKLQEENKLMEKDGYIFIPRDMLYLQNQILLNFIRDED